MGVITKIKATQLAKTSQKAVYSLLSTLLTATLVISASLFLYGTFYYAYMPKEVHESGVNFEFTPCEDPPAMCSFPKATIDTRRQKLMTGQPYSINMLLEVPDSPNNHAMGMFMSCINMRTAEGKTIREVCKSNILEYRSPLLRVLETLVFSPLLLTSTSTQRQWISINYFREFMDDPHSPATHIDLEIRSRHVHVYSATLQVHAEFTGLRAIMYHHPWFSTLMGVSSNIFILSVIILISWARFIAPEVSEVSSGEEEHKDGGDKDEQELVEDAPDSSQLRFCCSWLGISSLRSLSTGRAQRVLQLHPQCPYAHPAHRRGQRCIPGLLHGLPWRWKKQHLPPQPLLLRDGLHDHRRSRLCCPLLRLRGRCGCWDLQVRQGCPGQLQGG